MLPRPRRPLRGARAQGAAPSGRGRRRGRAGSDAGRRPRRSRTRRSTRTSRRAWRASIPCARTATSAALRLTATGTSTTTTGAPPGARPLPAAAACAGAPGRRSYCGRGVSGALLDRAASLVASLCPLAHRLAQQIMGPLVHARGLARATGSPDPSPNWSIDRGGARAFYALHTADQWLALALDAIGALLAFLISMLVVGLKGQLGASKSALVLERVRPPRIPRPLRPPRPPLHAAAVRACPCTGMLGGRCRRPYHATGTWQLSRLAQRFCTGPLGNTLPCLRHRAAPEHACRGGCAACGRALELGAPAAQARRACWRPAPACGPRRPQLTRAARARRRASSQRCCRSSSRPPPSWRTSAPPASARAGSPAESCSSCAGGHVQSLAGRAPSAHVLGLRAECISALVAVVCSSAPQVERFGSSAPAA